MQGAASPRRCRDHGLQTPSPGTDGQQVGQRGRDTHDGCGSACLRHRAPHARTPARLGEARRRGLCAGEGPHPRQGGPTRAPLGCARSAGRKALMTTRRVVPKGGRGQERQPRWNRRAPGKGGSEEEGRSRAELQGRGVRGRSPAPSSAADSSRLPHPQPVPGEPGFRCGVRSQAPAPAKPLLPLGSRPVSAKGRSCRFRRGRAVPHTRHALAPRWPRPPPVHGASALSLPPGSPWRTGWPPHAAPPFSAHPALRGAALCSGAGAGGWVSANGQGPGDRHMGVGEGG